MLAEKWRKSAGRGEVDFPTAYHRGAQAHLGEGEYGNFSNEKSLAEIDALETLALGFIGHEEAGLPAQLQVELREDDPVLSDAIMVPDPLDEDARVVKENLLAFRPAATRPSRWTPKGFAKKI